MTARDTTATTNLGRLFDGLPRIGWELRPAAAQPFEQDPSDVAMLAELESEMLSLGAEKGRIAEMRAQLATPGHNGTLVLWGVSGLVFSLLLLAAGVPRLPYYMLLAFLCILAFCWPYYALTSVRREVGTFDRRRDALASAIGAMNCHMDRLRVDHALVEEQRVAGLLDWSPVSAPAGQTRVEVFGGTKVGWEAFLSTYGASLLATPSRLLVVDATERHVGTKLARLVLEAERAVRYLALPVQSSELDLFAGMSSREVVDCVVAAWHDVEADQNLRADLVRDAFVLERICECLDPAPITLPRLAGAVLMLLSVEPREPSAQLTETERIRLEGLFGDQLRHGGQFNDRLLTLGGFLTQLDSGPLAARPLSLARMDTDLTMLELTPDGHLGDKRALVAVIVQALQRLYRRKARGDILPTHLVLLGADSVGREALDRLSRFAADAGVQVAYLFESLHASGAEVIGTGEAVQCFMRLGNRKEAERAADHLGMQRKFVLSGWSTSQADSVSETYGEHVSTSHGHTIGMMTARLGDLPLILPNVSTNGGAQTGISWGKQTGKSTQKTESFNRVHEHAVEPEVIQHLGEYTVLIQRNHDQVTAAECDPELALRIKGNT